MAAYLLAGSACHRQPISPEEPGDALRTTDGVLAASNLDTERAVLVDLLQTRAQLFGRLDDYDEAEAVAKAAVEKAPHLPESWLARASNRLALHRFAEALEDLREAQRRGADADAVPER